uniref:Serine/threonine-protein phosphatase 2A activator n=1 Tax=Astyanax mexicanus TaxID=7994 RepID=A0A8B9GUM8_ASTMX
MNQLIQKRFHSDRLNSACRPCTSTEDDGPPISAKFNFMVPKKEISMVPDMGKWKRSQAYADYMGFVLTLNEGVKGKKLTCEYPVSETVEKLLSLLGTLDRWIDETPPVDQPSRFGNKAYRTWYAKLDQDAEALVSTLLPPDVSAAAPEIAVYLKEAVGNSTRIDYVLWKVLIAADLLADKCLFSWKICLSLC